MHMMRILMAGLVGQAVAGTPAWAQRADSVNPVRVVTATFLGDEGSQWLSAGGFLPNGDILVCGVTVDPEITLLGQKAQVLGRDAAPLRRIREWERLGHQDTGRIAVPAGPDPTGLRAPVLDDDFSLEEPPTPEEIREAERANAARIASVPAPFRWREAVSVEERDLFVKLHWMQPEATGFMAIFSPDLKTVRTLRRLPRGAGSITSAAVAADGAIYIAGAATDRLANLPGPRETLTPERPAAGDNAVGARHTYLARLAPDLSSVEWIREFKGWSIAPHIRVLHNGKVAIHTSDVRTFTPDGATVHVARARSQREALALDFNPVDGRHTRAGDWMSPTGREPYRNPFLHIYEPDGTVLHQLYRWRGPFAGIDPEHLVADSAVRRTAFDPEGNLFYSTWSHGGNNVMRRLPYDIERPAPNRLGHSNMETVWMVKKLGPDYNQASAAEVTGNVNALFAAVDGSAVWNLGSGFRVRPTANALTQVSQGSFLAVADPDLGAYRFASTLPGTADRVAIRGDYLRAESWAFATGMSQGRPMLLALSGALPEGRVDGQPFPVPTRNPMQERFGGGLMDGYLIVMDLSTSQPWPVYEPPPRPERGEPRPHPTPLPYPGEGQVFDFGTERFMTVRVTLRDEHDAMWPQFYGGRSDEGGTLAFGAESSQADFVLFGNYVPNGEGDLSRMVGGELLARPPEERADERGNFVRVHVTGAEPWERLPHAARFGARHFALARSRLSGTLHVGRRSVPFADAVCTARFEYPRVTDLTREDARPNRVILDFRFTVSGEAIGLTGDLAPRQIRVRVLGSATSPVDYSDHIEVIEVPAAPGEDLPPPTEGILAELLELLGDEEEEDDEE